jgi:hypothetical protein
MPPVFGLRKVANVQQNYCDVFVHEDVTACRPNNNKNDGPRPSNMALSLLFLYILCQKSTEWLLAAALARCPRVALTTGARPLRGSTDGAKTCRILLSISRLFRINCMHHIRYEQQRPRTAAQRADQSWTWPGTLRAEALNRLLAFSMMR